VYSLPVAYILWAVSGFGALGFHRFYLRNFGTGVLWFFTGGMGMIGSVYDFFTLPDQVREANIKKGYRRALQSSNWRDMDDPVLIASMENTRPLRREDTIETVILKTAKRNGGIATPSEVALEGNFTVDSCKQLLDQLVNKGFCELRVRKTTGALVYVFEEFLTDAVAAQLETI